MKNIARRRRKIWRLSRRNFGTTKIRRTLFHRWRDGERDNVQLLEGYAFLLSGVIELYEATLEPEHLDFAIELAEAMIAKFYDAENGGFWQSAADAKDLILRVKDDYDGAEPSGNSVATLALLKLAAITGREDFKKPAEATLRLFAHRLQNFPQAMPFMLHALDFWLEEPRRVVIAGDANSANVQRIVARRAFGLSAEQNCFGQHRRGRGIRAHLPAKRRPGRLSLHRQCVPAADKSSRRSCDNCSVDLPESGL